jgi:hypothetical protein
MLKLTLLPLSILITTLWTYPQSATAFNMTLTNGSNSAEYDDDNDIGFTSWEVNNQNLLTQTGWFYRLNNTGTAQSLNTLIEGSITNNNNSARLPYTGDGFTLNLDLSLNNNGSTLNQIATVNNDSSSNLILDLYYYSDLVTSNGNSGDTIIINPTNYTASQSGDLNTIITTVTNSNSSLMERRSEVDAIDFADDTLINKLQFPVFGNTPSLNGTFNTTSVNYPVSSAYQWNYNLAAGESFEIGINSKAVPFEFSPSLGLFTVGLFSLIYGSVAKS